MIRNAGLSFEELRERMPMCPGVTYHRYERGELRPDGKPGFNTPTGKIELYSTEFERFGLDPLPYYEVPYYDAERLPELNRKYPLQLVTGGRVSVFFNAEHRNVPGLRIFNPHPLVDVHPKDADKWQVEDGMWVWLVSHYGRAKRSGKANSVMATEQISSELTRFALMEQEISFSADTPGVTDLLSESLSANSVSDAISSWVIRSWAQPPGSAQANRSLGWVTGARTVWRPRT
jgi:predicted molibdopterin-dependent oxidoreductase YjgC